MRKSLFNINALTNFNNEPKKIKKNEGAGVRTLVGTKPIDGPYEYFIELSSSSLNNLSLDV